MRPLTLLVLLMFASAAWLTARADEVTIYRCTDAAGHLTLRDTPCAKGQKQDARSMLRPKDAPAPVITKQRAPRERDNQPAPARVVVISAPRPLYECITPDGDRYTSDTDEGNPRWVPLWTLGYPVYPGPYPGMLGRTELSITHGSVRIDGNRTVLTPPLAAVAYGAGTWVRDRCQALPQQEVCARLLDRRDEIRRRFFNAMPSERDVLRVEERGINARLDNDCGGY
ncbi:MAG TPA: DUF4124 domain-containing protein [Luteimonas sp.]|nr:DUF4124 domain-containing protein [Luteimonas sp.]